MRFLYLALLLGGCAYESPSGTYEITPHERAGGTCGPGHQWVEQLDKHSSATHSYDRDGLHYEDVRRYDLGALTGYVEQTATMHEPATLFAPATDDIWCSSVYDLTLREIE